jgi:hypothetical protein
LRRRGRGRVHPWGLAGIGGGVRWGCSGFDHVGFQWCLSSDPSPKSGLSMGADPVGRHGAEETPGAEWLQPGGASHGIVFNLASYRSCSGLLYGRPSGEGVGTCRSQSVVVNTEHHSRRGLVRVVGLRLRAMAEGRWRTPGSAPLIPKQAPKRSLKTRGPDVSPALLFPTDPQVGGSRRRRRGGWCRLRPPCRPARRLHGRNFGDRLLKSPVAPARSGIE